MMKNTLLLIFLSHLSLAQVQTLSNSVGIGKSTLSTIPFHINNPNGSGEVARFQGGSPYISFFDEALFKGYIQVIANTFELGSKNNSDINFYTGDMPRFNINGITGQSTFLQRLNLNSGLKLNGPLLAAGESTGTEGMVLVSNGTATPSWEAISSGGTSSRVGFTAELTNSLTLTSGAAVKLTDFTEIFDDGNNFNPVTGDFTAHSSGVYSFTFHPQILSNSTVTPLGSLLNVRVILRIFKNTYLEHQSFFDVNISSTHGSGVSSHALFKLNSSDIISFRIVQTSGRNQMLGSIYSLATTISGFKVY